MYTLFSPVIHLFFFLIESSLPLSSKLENVLVYYIVCDYVTNYHQTRFTLGFVKLLIKLGLVKIVGFEHTNSLISQERFSLNTILRMVFLKCCFFLYIYIIQSQWFFKVHYFEVVAT